MTEPSTTAGPSTRSRSTSSGRPCLVVGGGPVAARKARTLLECGAAVTVIAPSLSGDMEALVPSLHAVERAPLPRRRRVRRSGSWSRPPGIPDVDGAVYADAEAAGVWVNSADDRAHCSFILPAVHRDGAVTVCGVDGRAEPGAGLVAPDPTGRAVRRGLGTLAQLLGEARAAAPARRGCAATRWTGRRCSTARCPTLVRSGDLDNARAIVRSARWAS